MIVADTNLLSEPFRVSPDPRVLTWLSEHAHEIAITTISTAELFYGALRLPESARRTKLLAAIDQLTIDAGTRLLTFDEKAARQYAKIRRHREAAGHTVSTEDTMIAGICSANGCAIATRNTKDFAGAGITVINPWNETPAD